MRNKALRFGYKKEDDTPGPADYDPKIRTRKTPRPDLTVPPGKGRLYVCKTPYTYGVSPPSIPTHIDENGYTIDAQGDIRKVPADDHDCTLGPAFYAVSTVITA